MNKIILFLLIISISFLSLFGCRNKTDVTIDIEDPSAEELSDQEQHKHMGFGWNLMEEGKYEDAIKEFNKVIELNPNNPEPYKGRGSAYRWLKNYDEAVSDLNKALSINPNDDFTYVILGFCLNKQGKYEEAINQLNKAIEINPDYDRAYHILGAVYMEKGDYEAALEYLEKAKELKKSNPSLYFYFAKYYYKTEDYNSAKENIDKCLSFDIEQLKERGNELKNNIYEKLNQDAHQ